MEDPCDTILDCCSLCFQPITTTQFDITQTKSIIQSCEEVLLLRIYIESKTWRVCTVSIEFSDQQSSSVWQYPVLVMTQWPSSSSQSELLHGSFFVSMTLKIDGVTRKSVIYLFAGSYIDKISFRVVVIIRISIMQISTLWAIYTSLSYFLRVDACCRWLCRGSQ